MEESRCFSIVVLSSNISLGSGFADGTYTLPGYASSKRTGDSRLLQTPRSWRRSAENVDLIPDSKSEKGSRGEFIFEIFLEKK